MDLALQTQQTLFRKHKLPGTNFPADHFHFRDREKRRQFVTLESMGNRVDRQKVVFDWTADITGTGDRSENMV